MKCKAKRKWAKINDKRHKFWASPTLMNENSEQQTKETKTVQQIIEQFNVCNNLIVKATGDDRTGRRVKEKLLVISKVMHCRSKSPAISEMINWIYCYSH